MSEDRIQEALALFREVCELPKDQRAAFLDTACRADTDLRREVESMLSWDETEGDVDGDAGKAPSIRAALAGIAQEAELDSNPGHIGDYDIVKLIAHGGMGSVYEAVQANPSRHVAIKVAHMGGTTNERAKRFHLEAQLLANLQHPGIAQIIEAGTTDDEDGARAYIVMELVRGRSLTEWVTSRQCTTRERLELMVDVCKAVQFAHCKGVIHRDLKPDNVLIEDGADSEGEGKPKVLDFGVAKVEDAAGIGAATMRTEAGRVIGTMGYMAPEQLSGATHGIGPAADVYSLGVMIYQLLSGRLPHELDAVTFTRALAVVTSTDAPLLGVVRPEHRGDIEAVVAKALEKDPRHRYADAGALQEDLERFLRGEPVLARSAGPLMRVTKWTRRNPALSTAVFGLFLLISTTVAVLLIKNHEVRAALALSQRLLDARHVAMARSEADALWPTRFEQVRGLEAWIRDKRELVGRTPVYVGSLDLLRAESGTLVGHTWEFSDSEQRRQHDELESLVKALEDLKSDSDLFARVSARLQLAASIEARTVTERKADWDLTIARIQKNPCYSKLQLEPQTGLVPLGPDPVSGLEEFLHFETHSGDLPPMGKGIGEMSANTGLVFVLIPGGTYLMGAQSGDEDGPNYDPQAIDFMEEPHQVTVDAFFLSKYEMTIGQWQRFVCGKVTSKANRQLMPVDQVSWQECTEAMRRLGLILPHEEQWEFAARGKHQGQGGAATVWWAGDSVHSLEGKENLFDLTQDEWSPGWKQTTSETPAPWHDKTKLHRLKADMGSLAPVGSYASNGFGLYDIGGSVSEWCSNAVDYRQLDEGQQSTLKIRPARGGNLRRGVVHARSAARTGLPMAAAWEGLGLRPAMEIHD